MQNISIYDILNEPLKLTPPIRMFEAFSGIGTQAMALKRLGVDYELVGFSEIDKYAIQSYHAIHGDVKNYGDITKMVDIPSCDIFTWSFPCTDLSLAGKQLGMTNNTRSGLVYEVLRLVRDTKDKPKVLIMENVYALISKKFINQFEEIKKELEEQGYTNYVGVLNAKDYGVAQNRKRVFMVSTFGEYSYDFPKPFPLEKKLKDYLEDVVDQKYYLSDKLLKVFNDDTNRNGFIRKDKFKPHIKYDGYAFTITTLAGNRATDNFIQEPMITYALSSREHQTQGWKDISPTLCARDYKDPKVISDKSKIRKLTPKEAWRLMGIDDKDFEKAQAVCSNSQLYKQAGNAIVVDVFEYILKKMIGD